MGVQDQDKTNRDVGEKTCSEENKTTCSTFPKVSTSEGVSFSQHQPQVRVLSLNHGEHLNCTLFRLQKGYVLQLRKGPSLFGRKLFIYTNHPEDPSEAFVRTKYRRLAWKSYSKNRGDDTALYVEVPLTKAGSFHFYFTYNESDSYEKSDGSGYYIVDPILTVGKDSRVVPLDTIQCQTVMAKCLGPLNRWESALKVSKESGYNMIHLTPIQELGVSRSGYSLANQLKLNPDFSDAQHQYGMDDVRNIIKKMRKEWNILTLTDIVLNHTANESSFLQIHPECSYNMVTAPYLRPSYVIDRALYHFSEEISKGLWAERGIPKYLCEDHHVEAIEKILFDQVFKPVKVEEFFSVNVDQVVAEFCTLCKSTPSADFNQRDEHVKNLIIIQDPNHARKSSTVDMKCALAAFNVNWPYVDGEENQRNKSIDEILNHLMYLNGKKQTEVHEHLRKAVSCIIGTIRYERLQDDGPKILTVSAKHPLAPPYFTHHGPDLSLAEEEELCFSSNGAFLMAHNGWVMGDDPLSNFARVGSNVYLRRELVAWGDSVKLRYGDKPEDCPYLWDHMRQYVEETASLFHGIRLDNCHSTPIYVAEYLLDCARRIRPDLYVIAELFTNSDQTDNIFVNRLGINSLIREAMSAPNSHEEGRLVYLYGGEPVGAFLLPKVRPLVPSIAHAIFLDLTHDNKSPCEVRSAWDMLPSTALVSMACCATGSSRGYDEIVPHHIHVVDEERKYTAWGDPKLDGFVNKHSGLIGCKKILNELHSFMGLNGFCQVFVDQVTEHIVTVTRHNAVTHESIILVAYTSFKPPAHIQSGYIRPLKVEGKLEEIMLEFNVKPKTPGDDHNKVPSGYVKSEKYVNGVSGMDVKVKRGIQPHEATLVKQVSQIGDETTVFEYTDQFRPGCVIAFRVRLLHLAHDAVETLNDILTDFEFGFKATSPDMNPKNQELLNIVSKLNMSDVNRILFRCDQEEKDEGRGGGAYNVEKVGPFVYCGLQGLISSLCPIRVSNDLGHPVCGNLRDGDWLPNYVSQRLKVEPSTKDLGIWLEGVFVSVSRIPRYLIPAYFDAIVNSLYMIVVNHSWSLMGRFISDGSDFCKALGLCSAQFCGVVKSSLLPVLSPHLEDEKPPHEIRDGEIIQTSVTLAAGLPHFSTGYMRNWGRDTFIALPGNLLITQRYQEARFIILAFAGTLRHGLIPNLLDGGKNARFNCRDSVWFWLYSIQRYVYLVPEGHKILKDKVSRLFPTDDSPAQEPGSHDQLLEEVIQEAMQRHFEGVKFRERNAGYKIDDQMTDNGFNNQIGVSRDTGFPFGGNVNNCGTWMDKMGSSDKAGNKGVPATPRDGSAVEIVGLCKAACRFLNEMYALKKYPYEGVSANDEKWSYNFWSQKISLNFEKHFWIGDTDSKDIEVVEPHPELINRTNIYKDSLGASQTWGDYQLRCNFPIALSVAPEMVAPERGLKALQTVEDILLGPLGIKTLDPSDYKYRGDYDNANDSSDPSVAKGFNYHQGPEWLWPVGWFFNAKLRIAAIRAIDEPTDGLQSSLSAIKGKLAEHLTHLSSGLWRSLPELTNSEGKFCRDSNPAQSWSTGCLLEVLYEMNKIERDLNISLNG